MKSRPTPRAPRPSVGVRLNDLLLDIEQCSRAVQSLANDLEHHKRQQEQVRRQIDHFSPGQKITRTGSWAWNVSSRKLCCSREHFRIFGLPTQQQKITSRDFFRMIHADERARVEQDFHSAVRSGRDFEAEYRIVRRDGSLRYIHTQAHPVFGESGKLTEYVGTVVDITEQRDGEDSLGSMQADLARASRAVLVRQLMAIIAHEVNQPLAALVANAGAARRWLEAHPPRLDKTRQALTRIVRDGNRASEIIARTRSLVGGEETQRESLNVNTIIQEVLVLMRTELRRNNITVRAGLEEGLPQIPCDRVQMQQVLLNLVANAIEAMSEVETRRRLLTLTSKSGVAAIRVAVVDRGVGLDAPQLERVFEPFYTTKLHGMGIGLALCRTIIETHGGRLWASPNPRAGATFSFELPCNGTPVG